MKKDLEELDRLLYVMVAKATTREDQEIFMEILKKHLINLDEEIAVESIKYKGPQND
jgi:hypothetical protein